MPDIGVKTGKYKSKEVWLSDGTPVLYERSEGKRTRIDRPGDEVVDSVKEWKRFQHLTLLQRAGQITGLRRQVPYELLSGVRYNGETLKKRVYYADFVYEEGGKTVIEDVKSSHTKTLPDYRLKRHLLIEKHVVPFAGKVEFREVI